MPMPSARATTRHRQAEHTVVRAVSVTAATTACQVTARSPSLNGTAPTCRPRNHSTVTPAARRSNDGPKRRTAGKGALPTVRLATILGLLATAALLGVVSATSGLGVAGWIVGLATGSAATVLLVSARMRSDQPAMFPADWVTLTRALLIAG